MTRLASLALLLATGAGCIIVDRDDHDHDDFDDTPWVPVNSAPYVYDAVAGCYYDTYNRDDIWYFEATVDDADGPYDIVAAYADVYDDRTGQLVQSFDLYPTSDPYAWFSDWLASTTWLDCYYPFYSVDFVVFDAADASGVYTVIPATY